MNSIEYNPKTYTSLIDELINKYKYNDYMMNRVEYHINSLSSILENEEKSHEDRLTRNNFLTSEQNLFIQLFLNKNQYYVLPNTPYYYQYSGKHFTKVREDDIHHQILTSISKDRVLMPWKYKTKVTLMKMIKDRHLFTSIPESDTIQFVLNQLCPAFFSRKNKAKYFLTIIGDNLLKKNTDLIYLISPMVKKYMSDLDTISYLTTGITNVTNTIVSKYHENYMYDKCRLVDMNDKSSNDSWRLMLNNCELDLLCVAAHYSDRYGSAETFLKSSDDICDYVLYMKNHNQTTILDTFCSQYIEKVENINKDPPTNIINWKNMHYIWKLFVSRYSLPNVIYLNNLKSMLKDKYVYDEVTESFQNVTSTYLPMVSEFLCFWDSCITSIDAKKTNGIDYEIEIDELHTLFKMWIVKNSPKTKVLFNGEGELINMLNHYYPSIEVTNDKFIINISCTFWNKIEELDICMNDAKNHYRDMNDNGLLDAVMIPITELYTFYVKRNKSCLAISKPYFEKYIYNMLHAFVEFDGFISVGWLTT